MTTDGERGEGEQVRAPGKQKNRGLAEAGPQ